MSICSICMDVINDSDPDKMIKTNCGHVFHDQCLTAWIDRGKNNYHSDVATCPLCREWFYKEDEFKTPSLFNIIIANISRLLQIR